MQSLSNVKRSLDISLSCDDVDGSRAAFTRALTCLSKYGDDLSIYATPDVLSFSATNSSLSAYCRFRYGRQFFVKYCVGDKNSQTELDMGDVRETRTVTGQLLTKASR